MSKDKVKDKIITRHCVICSKKITVVIAKNRTYKGNGHYFGKMRLDKNRNPEYWECDNCYFQK